MDERQRLRLIQCGVGGFGESWLSRIVAASDDFSIEAIVDPDPSALRRGAEIIPHARPFSCLEEALQSGVGLDAALIVTPPRTHRDLTIAAMEAGLHCLVEKPIAQTIEEAREMARVAGRTGRRLVVSQNYRFRPAAMKLRQMLLDGELGPLGHGHVDFSIPADFTGTFRENMPHVLLADMAIHHLDLIRHVTGRNILEVTATTFRPSWSWYGHNPAAKMLLRMEGDVWFSYSGDWSARGRNTGWSGDWRIQCERGSIHWRFDSISVARSSRGFVEDSTESPIEIPTLSRSDRAATLARFAQSIRSGQPAPTDARDNLWSFAAIEAAVRSAEEGRAVAVGELLG